MKKACTGKPAQWAEINVRLVVIVVSGDEARQHARIGRMRLPADYGQTHAWHWAHTKTLEHCDVAMPAADEHQILDDRVKTVLHGLSRCGWSVDPIRLLAQSGATVVTLQAECLPFRKLTLVIRGSADILQGQVPENDRRTLRGAVILAPMQPSVPLRMTEVAGSDRKSIPFSARFRTNVTS